MRPVSGCAVPEFSFESRHFQRGRIGGSSATIDEVCNIFLSACAFLLVRASCCAQEYYPQTSLSSLFSALQGPPLQKNSVLETNVRERESMESIVSSFLT